MSYKNFKGTIYSILLVGILGVGIAHYTLGADIKKPQPPDPVVAAIMFISCQDLHLLTFIHQSGKMSPTFEPNAVLNDPLTQRVYKQYEQYLDGDIPIKVITELKCPDTQEPSVFTHRTDSPATVVL